MYLRTPLHPTAERPRFGPVLVGGVAVRLVTLAIGVYPRPLQQWVQMAIPAPSAPAPVTVATPPGR